MDNYSNWVVSQLRKSISSSLESIDKALAEVEECDRNVLKKNLLQAKRRLNFVSSLEKYIEENYINDYIMENRGEDDE